MKENISIWELIHLPKKGIPLKISIRVGMEQTGDITFVDDSGEEHQATDRFEYSVSNSDILDNKRFAFNILCSDKASNHDKLLVTVELEGVKNSSPWTLFKEVDKGGSYDFTGTIEFYK